MFCCGFFNSQLPGVLGLETCEIGAAPDQKAISLVERGGGSCIVLLRGLLIVACRGDVGSEVGAFAQALQGCDAQGNGGICSPPRGARPLVFRLSGCIRSVTNGRFMSDGGPCDGPTQICGVVEAIGPA